MIAVVDVTWQFVVLLLGLVGLALGAVCFAVWILRPKPPSSVVVAPRELWPGEREDVTRELPSR